MSNFDTVNTDKFIKDDIEAVSRTVGSIWENLVVKRKIASSENADIYLASDGRRYANVKVLYIEQKGLNGLGAKKTVSVFMKHMKSFKPLYSCENIVKVDDCRIIETRDEQYPYIIFIKSEPLTLFSDYYLKMPPEEEDVARMGIDMLNALEYSEKINIIHNYIDRNDIYVSGFGSFLLDTSTSCFNIFGSDDNLAPEINAGNRSLGALSDIYSVGAVMKQYLQNSSSLIYSTVSKACSEDPGQRYSSVEEFRRELISSYNRSHIFSSRIVRAKADAFSLREPSANAQTPAAGFYNAAPAQSAPAAFAEGMPEERPAAAAAPQPQNVSYPEEEAPETAEERKNKKMFRLLLIAAVVIAVLIAGFVVKGFIDRAKQDDPDDSDDIPASGQKIEEVKEDEGSAPPSSYGDSDDQANNWNDEKNGDHPSDLTDPDSDGTGDGTGGGNADEGKTNEEEYDENAGNNGSGDDSKEKPGDNGSGDDKKDDKGRRGDGRR